MNKGDKKQKKAASGVDWAQKILRYNYNLIKQKRSRTVLDKLVFLKEMPKLYKTWRSAEGYKPLSINMYCTYRCNLCCKHCGFGRDVAPKALYKNELTTQECFKFFEDAGKLGTEKLHFTGGEPFLRSDIIDLIAYAKKHIPFVNLTTNGTLITENIAEDLVKNLDAIKFSIDGNEEGNDHARGVKGAWKKSMDGLRNINNAKKKWNPKLMVGINCLVNATNYRMLDELIDGLHEAGDPDLVQFSPLFEYIEIKDEKDVKLFLTGDESHQFIETVIPRIERKAKQYGIAIQYAKPAEYVEVEGLLNKYRIDYCYHPWSWLILSPHGNIFPCGGTQYDNFFGEDLEATTRYIMGNIRSSTLKEIWNNSKYLNFRKRCNPLSHDICNYCCHIRNVKAITDRLNSMPLIGDLPAGLRSFIAYSLSVEPSIVSMAHKNIAFMAKRKDV